VTATATATGQPPEDLPIWARLRLAALGIKFRRVTHFLRSDDVIGAAVDGEPAWLRKGEA
jgi:hypothetical protein